MSITQHSLQCLFTAHSHAVPESPPTLPGRWQICYQDVRSSEGTGIPSALAVIAHDGQGHPCLLSKLPGQYSDPRDFIDDLALCMTELQDGHGLKEVSSDLWLVCCWVSHCIVLRLSAVCPFSSCSTFTLHLRLDAAPTAMHAALEYRG